jgi:hypothetical protein
MHCFWALLHGYAKAMKQPLRVENMVCDPQRQKALQSGKFIADTFGLQDDGMSDVCAWG